MIKLSSLGDIVHALPVLHALKFRWPQARVDWLVDETYAGLLEGHPELDEVVPLPRRRSSAPMRLAGVVRDLRARDYDTVVDLQGLFRSGLLAALAGGKLRVGFANGREFSPLFYNLRVEVPTMDMHAVDRYLLVAQALGASADGAPEFTLPEPEDARRVAEGALSEGGALNILVSPMTRWRTKCWPAERYAALADGLIGELQAKVCFLGSRADRRVIEGILVQMGKRAADLSGTTLPELVALIREADILVTPDSGPMHIAAVVGTPVVALFGPTNPVRTGPYTRKAKVLRAPLACSPCYRRRCRTIQCMKAITVDEVLGAVRELLDER